MKLPTTAVASEPGWLACSGLPNARPGACRGLCHSVCSWNARALFLNRGSCTKQAAAKLSHWRRLVEGHCMVGAPETHGNFAEVKHQGDRMRHSHFLAWSPLECCDVYNNQDAEHSVSLSEVSTEAGDESGSDCDSVFSSSSLGGASGESGCSSPKEKVQCPDDGQNTSGKSCDVKACSRVVGALARSRGLHSVRLLCVSMWQSSLADAFSQKSRITTKLPFS